MRRLALFIALAVAASTTSALAEPDRFERRDRGFWGGLFDGQVDVYIDTDDDRYRDRRYREPRYDRHRAPDRWQRDFRGRWVPIAEGYSARSGRQFIQPPYHAKRLRKLRIESSRGAPVITQIAVEYVGDPNTQVVRLDTRLPRGTGEVVDLNRNREIRRIIVYTDPSYRGSYSIYGT